MKTVVRLFEALDLEECSNLFVSTFSKEPWNERWSYELVLSRLDQIFNTPLSTGVIYEADNTILGFALGFYEPWHNGHVFYLKEACVTAENQRQGIGTQLMLFLMEQCRKKQTEKIYLLTSRGDLSEKFYKKLGFYTSEKMIMMGKYL